MGWLRSLVQFRHGQRPAAETVDSGMATRGGWSRSGGLGKGSATAADSVLAR